MQNKDPKLAYDLTTKELLDEKVNELIKKLDVKKQTLKSCVDDLNTTKSTWIDTIHDLREKTKWGIGEYIDLILSVLNAEALNLKDHYKWINLLTSEKGKQFENSQSMKHLNNKK